MVAVRHSDQTSLGKVGKPSLGCVPLQSITFGLTSSSDLRLGAQRQRSEKLNPAKGAYQEETSEHELLRSSAVRPHSSSVSTSMRRSCEEAAGRAVHVSDSLEGMLFKKNRDGFWED